ncbi:MAG: sigma-70 family RNA polymerase sigma factor [Deltaproteobacteria bacterium]|nr:sigma-70 family RNA polymerase sigma factor [Deltaproteobacteria bacterium]
MPEPSGSTIDAARAGRSVAQQQLYAEALGQIRRFARSLGLRVCELPEVAHEAAAQVLLELDGFRAESSFASWVYSIARHQQIRRARARRPDVVGGAEETAIAAAEESPEGELVGWEELCAGVRALLGLPERRGFALLAVRVLGMGAEPVAVLLNCKPNAVHQLGYKGEVQARQTIESESGPRWPAACGACRGPIAAGAAGGPPDGCPMRWLSGLTMDEVDLAACWNQFRILGGGGGSNSARSRVRNRRGVSLT